MGIEKEKEWHFAQEVLMNDLPAVKGFRIIMFIEQLWNENQSLQRQVQELKDMVGKGVKY